MNIFRRFLPTATNTKLPETDYSCLLPVLISASLVLPDDVLPPVPVGETGFGMTAAFCADAPPRYITKQQERDLANTDTKWQDMAMQNLRRWDKGFPFTQERRRDNGQLVWLLMQHEDGLGTSRLLLRDALSPRFPAGYRVALPDRSVGFAISNDTTDDEEQEVRQKIRLCCERAAIPGSPRLFPSEMFVL